MDFKKIHEDKRGFLYVVENLLEGSKEFSFMEIKEGFARGGCYHINDEYFVVVKGKVKFRYGKLKEKLKDKVLISGESGIIPKKISHSFEALEDSIVCEWGITTKEKEMDIKDEKHRDIVNKINQRK